MLLYPPPEYDHLEPQTVYDSTYWYLDEFGFRYDRTNKLRLDLPSVTIMIAASALGITEPSAAAADFALRAFIPYIDELNKALYNRSRPVKESGFYYIFRPDGAVRMRNASYFSVEQSKYYINRGGSSAQERPLSDPAKETLYLNILIQIQLPNKKHSKALDMLTKKLPMAVAAFAADFDRAALADSLSLSETQNSIRQWLKSGDYCAFIANGSILPRSKGTQSPLENAIKFKSPPEDEIEIAGIRGMGIKRGVTVVTGGGYSGKSTLLDAVSAGIYNHIRGDGRELCITDESAVEIAAEDGRPVRRIDISPFIKWIPGGNPSDFSTDHASGSTSQAANIMEAINSGCRMLLIDEDRSATNFMIRDASMRRLIKREPITPFTERVRELYRETGTSTLLVIGGSGEYLGVADNVILMNDFVPENCTADAFGVYKELTAGHNETPETAVWQFEREVKCEGFSSYPADSGTEKLFVSDMGFMFVGDERIDTRGLYNATFADLNAAGYILRDIMISLDPDKLGTAFDIASRLDDELLKIKENGLDCVFTAFFPDMERWFELPRKIELSALINRMKRTEFVK